ncbi:MAG: carbon starvation protein A, partial [Deltaproteobacteria bacterium]
MGALLIMVVAFVGYIIMYQLYGKFIGRKIFALSPEAKPPSVEFEDGKDYVPTRKEIIFGHHFTSIAGTGPITGPAVAVIWGWVPAMIWIFVGTIIMGAVHDFGAL